MKQVLNLDIWIHRTIIKTLHIRSEQNGSMGFNKSVKKYSLCVISHNEYFSIREYIDIIFILLEFYRKNYLLRYTGNDFFFALIY